MIVLIIIQGIACAIYSTILAKEKGYDAFGWFMAGLFFSVIALIAAAGLPDKKMQAMIAEIINQENKETALIPPTTAEVTP